jgi:hypothetical protein
MPHSPETKAKALEMLANAELTYPQIRDATKVPVGTLAGWAKAAGIERSGREKTANATAARIARIESRRSRVAERLITKIEDLLGRMDAPHVTFRLSKDGDPVKIEHDTATSTDVRNYAVGVGVLMDKFRLEMGEANTVTEQRREPKQSPAEELESRLDELAERRAKRRKEAG